MTIQPPQTPAKKTRSLRWLRAAMWIAIALMIGFLAHLVMGNVMAYVKSLNTISENQAMNGAILFAIIVYAILIAIPFMPGIEVGIALLLLKGAAIAPLVYLATVVGLFTAYLIGSFIPPAALAKIFADLGLRRASEYVAMIKTTPANRRLAQQRAMLPTWLTKLTVDYRYLTIGALLNPGTFAIGGGGGILMAAGLSRLFNGWIVLLTLLIATLPVPLTVWIMGVSILGAG